MIAVAVAVLLAVAISLAAFAVLGKHWTPTNAELYGRPWGAIAPTLWRHCPHCTRSGYVPAPGGHTPPCPCTTTGDPS